MSEATSSLLLFPLPPSIFFFFFFNAPPPPDLSPFPLPAPLPLPPPPPPAPRPGRHPRARRADRREDATATGPERRALSGLAPPASTVLRIPLRGTRLR